MPELESRDRWEQGWITVRGHLAPSLDLCESIRRQHSRFFEEYTIDRQEIDQHWVVASSKRQNFRIRRSV